MTAHGLSVLKSLRQVFLKCSAAPVDSKMGNFANGNHPYGPEVYRLLRREDKKTDRWSQEQRRKQVKDSETEAGGSFPDHIVTTPILLVYYITLHSFLRGTETDQSAGLTFSFGILSLLTIKHLSNHFLSTLCSIVSQMPSPEPGTRL